MSHFPSAGVNFGGGEESIVYHETPAEQLATFRAVRASGDRWLRWTIPMNTEEVRPGVFNWYPAAEISAAVHAGLEVDALLTTAPSWAYGQGGASSSDFAAFARAATVEYRPLGVSTFEIWNEENTTQAWGAAFTPARYTALLRASFSAIRSVAPGARVIVGGFAPAPDSAPASYEPLTFLAGMYAAGAHGSFTEVADHPYSFPNLPDQPASWNPFTYLPAMHWLMVRHGDESMRIWLTEYGAPASGPDGVGLTAQAQAIHQAFLWDDSQSWIGHLFVFDWQDDSYDGSFGLHTATGAPTPAGTVFATAASGADR